MANLKSLAKDTAIYGLSSIVGRFLNYLLVPLYTHYMPKDSGDYGISTNIYAYTALILVLLTFGMETTLFRFANDEKCKPDTVFSTVMSTVGSLTLVFLALIFGFITPISNALGYAAHPDYLLMMAVVVALDALQAIPFSYLRFQKRAMRFARKHDCSNFQFICSDVTSLPVLPDQFDTIIMNDFMEHVSEPEKTLRETMRILRPGGRAFINFPPYYHPFGAHLQDEIGVPWVHVLFDEQTYIGVYQSLVQDLPDGEERIRLRFTMGEDGLDHLTYINHMTIKRFEKMLERLAIVPEYYHATPLRPWLAPLAKTTACREYLSKMVTCVILKK